MAERPGGQSLQLAASARGLALAPADCSAPPPFPQNTPGLRPEAASIRQNIPMNRIPIPRTEVEVSRFCLGLADAGVRNSKAEALAHMDLFVERGGCFFDSAHCYAFWGPEGAGSADRILGEWIKTNGRSGIVLATKGGHSPVNQEAYPRRSDFLSRDVVEADIAQSLEWMGVDKVDLYYFHRDDPRVPVEELVDIMDDLHRRGMIGMAGASNWTFERLSKANAYAEKSGKIRFSVLQNQWSLARPSWGPPGPGDVTTTAADGAKAIAECEVLAAPWSPSAAGYFAGKDPWGGDYDTEANRALRQEAERIGREAGVSATTVALAWLIRQPCPVAPILGTWSAKHLAEALAAESLSADLAALNQGLP